MDATLVSHLKKELPRQRWFRQKNAKIKSITLLDSLRLPSCTWLWVRCTTADGVIRVYSVPRAGGAFSNTGFAADLIAAFRNKNFLRTEKGGGLRARWWTKRPLLLSQKSYTLKKEMTNTLCVFGNNLAVKLYRSPEQGTNPEIEMNTALHDSKYNQTPRFFGHIAYTSLQGKTYELMVVQEFVQYATDLWTYLQKALLKRQYHATYPAIRSCARALGMLHVSLASIKNKRFKPERYSRNTMTAWRRAIRVLAAEVRGILKKLPRNSIDMQAWEKTIARAVREFSPLKMGGKCIRQHGDFHLGQAIINKRNNIFILDFEGEPLVPLAERLGKFLPLKDLAGLMRSLHYASHAAQILGRSTDAAGLRAWYEKAREVSLDEYFSVTKKSSFLPKHPNRMLKYLELEKALYELKYEALNRPAWLAIPLEGINEAITGLSVP